MRIHHNDAREHLFTCHDRYDVVFSEPSNPYRVGIASLFTSEFYQAVQQRLNPGGVLVQWLQCYEIDEETVRMTLETIRSQFPHVEIWTGTPGDLLLVCSNEPLRHDAMELSGWMKKHPVRSAAIYAWRSVELESFLGHYVCGVATVDAFRGTPATSMITDDRNLLEYRFARTLGRSGEFGVDRLRALAFQQGDDKPDITGGDVDWSLVLDAWILQHGEAPGLKMEPDCAARAKSMRLFPEDCAGVIRVWESQPRPPRLLIEMTRLAQAYAILDQPKKARELMAQINEVDPLAARILDAQLLNQEGDVEGAGRLLVSVFEELSIRPWVDRAVGQDAFVLALILAERSPVQAERLLKTLVRPLSLYAFDSRRRDTLLAMAAHFNVRVQEAILAEFEPHVPWNEPFLRARRDIYRATSNSLAVQAERDLVIFLDQQINR